MKASAFFGFSVKMDDDLLQTYSQNFEQLLRSQNGQDIQALLEQVDARTGCAAQLFLGAIPVMLIYPFLRKYFTKSLVLGSVKG